jgi:hypothetical protein
VAQVKQKMFEKNQSILQPWEKININKVNIKIDADMHIYTIPANC